MICEEILRRAEKAEAEAEVAARIEEKMRRQRLRAEEEIRGEEYRRELLRRTEEAAAASAADRTAARTRLRRSMAKEDVCEVDDTD